MPSIIRTIKKNFIIDFTNDTAKTESEYPKYAYAFYSALSHLTPFISPGDLIVRIGGYSDYFTKTSPEMQDELILRTEHKI